MLPMISLFEYELVRVEVFWVSLVGIWLLYSLFAIWIAIQRWHWFLSFALTAAAASLLRIIEAGDLMLMQFSNGVTILVTVEIWKTLQTRKQQRLESVAHEHASTPQNSAVLSLANLFWGVAALAVLFSMLNVDLTNLISRSNSILFGFLVAFAFLCGIALGMVKSRWVALIAIVFVIFGSWQAFHLIYGAPDTAAIGTSFIWGDLERFNKAILIALAISGLLFSLLFRWNQQPKEKTLVVSRLGGGLAVITILIAAIATVDIYYKLTYRYPESEALAQPSQQFHKLHQISQRFESSQAFNTYLPDNDAVRKEVAIYADSFTEVRELLDTPTLLSERQNAEVLVKHLGMEVEDICQLRFLGRALTYKAHLEFSDGQFDQALADSIQCIRLRRPVSTPMLIFSEYVAMPIERVGHFSAAESIPSASRSAIETALRCVLKLDAAPHDLELIFTTNVAFYWNSESWLDRLWTVCDAKRFRQHFNEGFMNSHRCVKATRQQTITMLALELHRHDHGHYPKQLSALVPDYLLAEPLDPYGKPITETPLRYRQLESGADYLLYSVGFDRDDDGGRVSQFGYEEGQVDDGTDLNLRESARLERLELKEDRAWTAENPDSEVE